MITKSDLLATCRGHERALLEGGTWRELGGCVLGKFWFIHFGNGYKGVCLQTTR